MNTGEVFGNQAAGDEIIASESSRIRSSSATVRSMLDLLRVEVLVSGGLLVCSSALCLAVRFKSSKSGYFFKNTVIDLFP